MKYAWIATQRRDYPLPALCRTLAVSISGYRAWQRGGQPNRRRLTNAQLLALMAAIHAELKGAYGSPRMLRELRSRGVPVGKERVERLMRENGIRARHKRRYKATTDSKHGLPVAPNVLDRNFAPAAPNQVWSADLTYIWTDTGWLYLAIVLDLFNREVVGWSIKPRMTADIVVDALTMAWFRRPPRQNSCRPDRIDEPGGDDARTRWPDTERNSRNVRWRDCCRRKARRWTNWRASWALGWRRWSGGGAPSWRNPGQSWCGRPRRGWMRW